LPAVSDQETATPLCEMAVVVVNWNGRADLADCFGSLRDAEYPSLRVIMVDNGSVDDSVAWTCMHHPEVEIIETGENLRWAGGNNAALKVLRDEGFTGCILLLNNDTFVPGGSLVRLAEALRNDDQVWAATPRICYAADPARAWYDGGMVGKWTGWIRHAGIRRLTGKLNHKPRYIDYGTGCALLLAPGVLEKVGMLDEGFYFYGEDADYSLRIQEAGGKILHVPSALVLHKVSASVGAQSPRKVWLRSRSHVRLLRKHWPRYRWPILFFSHAAYLAGHACWHLVNGRLATAHAVVQGALDEIQGREY
jgi:GT2 family glycosyltransferase